jgi:lysozyme family protein
VSESIREQLEELNRKLVECNPWPEVSFKLYRLQSLEDDAARPWWQIRFLRRLKNGLTFGGQTHADDGLPLADKARNMMASARETFEAEGHAWGPVE